jgi:cold shock CspA family protein
LVWRAEHSSARDDKGYGFIKPYGSGSDLFFHIRQFEPKGTIPNPGARVRYDVAPSLKTGKDMAIDAHLIAEDRSW